MTDLPEAAEGTAAAAPPAAPLSMPKQVLTHPPGALLRALAAGVARLLPGLRRAG